MIPFTCPCCEVKAPPHSRDCTFHKDSPGECDDFNVVARLREDNERLREAIGRLSITDKEAIVLRRHVDWCIGFSAATEAADLIWRILHRHFEGRI